MKQFITLAFLFCCGYINAQPYHKINFTGDASVDFNDYEKNNPTGNTYCLSWDGKNLYVGVHGSATYIKDEPTLLFIDSDPTVPANGGTGSTTGFNYDDRITTLPFTANFVLYFKASYAELRTNTDGTWSDLTNVTSTVITGTNDIEIKIPWNVFPSGKKPASFSALMFKTNGFGGNTDAYEVRPGVTGKDDNYTSNVNSNGPQIFYRFITAKDYYTKLNIFGWIDNTNSTLCTQPSGLNTSNITNTTAKLKWTAVAGAEQYEVRRTISGTTKWKSYIINGSNNFQNANGLTCNTSYDWMVRTSCDTAGIDINSGFSSKKTFTTAACLSNNSLAIKKLEPVNGVTIYPIPAHKNASITITSMRLKNNAQYVIYNLTGKQIQIGTISNNTIKLDNIISAGNYLIEIRNGESVVRKKIVVIE